MRNVIAIARREWVSYFCSPMAYLVLAFWMIVLGFFFYDYMVACANFFHEAKRFMEASLETVYRVCVFISTLVCPIIAMRLLAEEKKTGTFELLMTAPVREREVVLGKFLGALAFYAVLLVTTLVYAIVLAQFGRVDVGVLASSYLGVLFVGAVFISVGLLISSLTSSQMIAGVISFAVLLVWVLLGNQARALGDEGLRDTLEYIGPFCHLEGFLHGMIDTRGVLYFVSVTALFIFIAIRVLESRKWK